MSNESENDKIFKALANDTRRDILDVLKDEPQTTGAVCARFPDLNRCTVMQHLNVLEEAGLVIAHKRGRQRWNYLNAIPIKQIHDRWIGPYAARATDSLSRLKTALETTSPADA